MRNNKKQEKQFHGKCGWHGCSASGEYPAPKSRFDLNEKIHFCLQHIRLYNKSWNFFGNMSQDEIEKFHQESLSGHRRTTKMGVGLGAAPWHEDIVRDRVFEMFGDEREQKKVENKIPQSELEALSILDLKYGVTSQQIKIKYKELAKKYHPDLNKSGADRFKAVTEAYNVLKKSGYL